MAGWSFYYELLAQHGDSVTCEISCWNLLHGPVEAGMVQTDSRRRPRIASSCSPVCQHQSCPQNGKVLEAARCMRNISITYIKQE